MRIDKENESFFSFLNRFLYHTFLIIIWKEYMNWLTDLLNLLFSPFDKTSCMVMNAVVYGWTQIQRRQGKQLPIVI